MSGSVIGPNFGTIIFGRPPKDDERKQLSRYLNSGIQRYGRLSLRGLHPKVDNQSKGLDLGSIFVEMSIERSLILRDYWEKLTYFFEDNDPHRPLRYAYDPDFALPAQAIDKFVIGQDMYETEEFGLTIEIRTPILIKEAIKVHQALILLGEPGAGKSTFLKHLAVDMARGGLMYSATEEDDATDIAIPVLVSCTKIASALTVYDSPEEAVLATLTDEIKSHGITNSRELLADLLQRGKALLLLDALDEVSAESIPDISADRTALLDAVDRFYAMYSENQIIMTCRARVFDVQLRDQWGGGVEAIAPFTLGQIRHFASAWYNELRTTQQLDSTQAERLAVELTETIAHSPKLESMASNPLLLTMMALVLYQDGTLPRSRPLLYERILGLLLGQWDKVKNGKSLAEAIGQPNWDSERVRPLIDSLSYQAHAHASHDGRGRLNRGQVYQGLIEFFTEANLKDPWGAAGRCLDYIQQRSGLLIPDSSDSYVFAHITLQEHCAGRYLLLHPDAQDLVLAHRTDDRWREAIFLGLGVIQRTNPALIDSILSDLIDDYEMDHPKLVAVWVQDLLFAAEIGEDLGWDYLRSQRINVNRIQRELSRNILRALALPHEALDPDDRERLSVYLGRLDDPDFPVAIERRSYQMHKPSEPHYLIR